MIIAALIVAILGCLFILFIGGRFLVAPKIATAGFGVAEDRRRAFTSIKGVRDITSGIVPLVVLLVAGPHVFGWALLAAAITPIGDAIIVVTNGGTLRHALSIHGATAAVLIAAGLILALG
ncbi:hypothetical protein BIV02_12455 [Curtobacterium sp. MMLR14_014]|uniref:DUF4267 domain-containing protein n=1 Tax=Curtobacterium TaxID=2034 RepID=UPI0008F834D4|nr:MULTISPECIES: DUF4267 domain-containing protein [Curtobacterium]MBB1197769.1 DUF4267 domain-containing protein [Curtobacterium flaccumfaciens]OII35612.1 hypothetical protein BIU91_04695 [Curtobacterium sp. MMLR14_002]OII45487.1 hypothetical protein BIV02_12455 [Curtobacterium sp. MMLR14_014]